MSSVLTTKSFLTLSFAVLTALSLNSPMAWAGGDKPSTLDSALTPGSGWLVAQNDSWTVPPGTLLAQADGDDAYDPFADYSEFEESQEEEEDINFFRNGRLLTMGFIGGYRGWTDRLGEIYTGSPGFGLFLSYFFDLRFALQFGFLTSDHTLTVFGDGFEPIQGNVSTMDLSFNLKYYFNTQNVTRGLADMNPYIIGGFSRIERTVTVSGNDNYLKDAGAGFNIGGGVELPIMRNKMFVGAQAMYQLVNFSDEAGEILDENEVPTGVTPSGDSYLVLGTIGVNF